MTTRKIITIDSETEPFRFGREKYTPFVWGVWDGETFHAYWEQESQFVKWLKDQEVIAYAHNGGKFDFLFLLPYVDAGTEVKIINNRVAELPLGKALLRDSYSLLPMSLAKMDKNEIDYDKFEPETRNQHAVEIIDYLKSDCIYLYDWITEFFKTAPKALTLASSAMKFYTQNYRKSTPQSTAYVSNAMRPYYYGGRVECVQPGTHQDINVWDINSAYPYAMWDTDHPYGNEFTVSRYLPDKIEEIELGFIDLNCYSRGAFPIRDKGLQFPIGHNRYLVTGHEYLMALDCDLIDDVTINSFIGFEETISFVEYVEHFYAEKVSATTKEDRMIAKLFLNSLYGKFGANPDNYSNWLIAPTKDAGALYAQGIILSSIIDENVSLYAQELTDSQKHYYHVGTAASITGHVRSQMMKAIAQTPTLYCDTDSIFCHIQYQPSNADASQDNLGNWKLEFEARDAFLIDKKMYGLIDEHGNTKIASKGVNLTMRDIRNLATGIDVTHHSIAPTMSIRAPNPIYLSRTIRGLNRYRYDPYPDAEDGTIKAEWGSPHDPCIE